MATIPSIISSVTRRLLVHLSRKPSAQVRFRPRLEALGERAVPAIITWVGVEGIGRGGITFGEEGNWSLGRIPQAGDDIVFNGSASSADCVNFETPTSGRYKSIKLYNGYSGDVSADIPIAAEKLDVRSGSIAFNHGAAFDNIDLSGGNVIQGPYVPGTSSGEIDVATRFDWIGGKLNYSTNLSALNVLPGATATITPGTGNTLITGSSLCFLVSANTPDVGGQGTINPGTVRFENSAGAVVGGAAVAAGNEAKLSINSGVTVTRSGTGRYSVHDGGKFDIVGPGSVTSELPLLIQGGKAWIRGAVTAQFTKSLHPGVNETSVLMTVGTLYLQSGATLDGANNITLTGGNFVAYASAGVSTTATVQTPKFLNSGADIYINFNDPNAHTSGTLLCTGDVEWTGGTYRPVVSAGANNSDLWMANGKFTVGNGAQLAPGTANGVAPAQNSTFEIIRGDGGIVGNAPAVNSPNVTYSIVPDNVNPTLVKKWFLKKS